MGAQEDLIDVVNRGNVNAIAMADILHYNRSNIKDIRKFAKESGISLRNYE